MQELISHLSSRERPPTRSPLTCRAFVAATSPSRTSVPFSRVRGPPPLGGFGLGTKVVFNSIRVARVGSGVCVCFFFKENSTAMLFHWTEQKKIQALRVKKKKVTISCTLYRARNKLAQALGTCKGPETSLLFNLHQKETRCHTLWNCGRKSIGFSPSRSPKQPAGSEIEVLFFTPGVFARFSHHYCTDWASSHWPDSICW